MPNVAKNTEQNSSNRIDINVDFKNSKIDIIGSDVIITASDGTQKTLQGLGVQLFSDNPPQVFSNGVRISPDDFLGKIGEVQSLDVKEIKDVLTTLKAGKGQAETDLKVESEDKIEIKEVIKEVVKIEQVFTDTASHNYDNPSSVYGDTDSLQTSVAAAVQKQQKQNDFKGKYDEPIEGLEPPKVTFSTPPTPTAKPTTGDGFASLGSVIKLLQTPYKFNFDEDTEVLTVKGGGGSLSASFNDGRATQVDPELIDLSEYVGKVEIFTDDSVFFNDNLVTRVVSFEAQIPNQYELSKLEIFGLPSGFSFLGHTPNSDGDYDFSTFSFSGGKIKLLLQYDPNQFSNTPTDIDGDGIANEYADFELTFNYEAALLPEVVALNPGAVGVEDLKHETIIPVVVKQASPDDFDYNNNPTGWVIDVDFNDNVLLTGNSDTTVYGSPSRDNITSGLGNDVINAAGGDDVIRAGVGQDIISGGIGDNSIDGGAGVDRLTYIERTENITLNLSEGANQDGFHTATLVGQFSDIIRDVENLILGSGNDIVRGSLDNNIIEGRDGNDTLDGALGNDTLLGGNGNDILRSGFGNNTLDGGTGTNTLEYAQSRTGVTSNETVLNSNGFYDVVNGIYTDKVKNINIFKGSNFNDTILGDAVGRTYTTLNGNDTIDGGEGLDIIDGGAGVDTVTYVSVTSGDISVVGSSVTDSNNNTENLANIENIHGSNFGDNFVGTTGINNYSGLGGDDNFVLSLGADIISGGIGTDTIDTSVLGIAVILKPILQTITSTVNTQINTSFSTIEEIIGTAGIDLIDYTTATNATTINLTTNTAQQTGQQSFSVINFDNVTTGSGNDIITGNALNNILNAGGGNDNLYASAGTDTINGGIGSDTFHVNTTQSGAINLTAQTITGFTGSDIANDTIIGIENITQTGSGNTTLQGSTENNNFVTGGGNDTFIFSNGTDTLNGNAGSDTFDYSNITTATTSLNLGVTNTNGFATFTSGTNTTYLRNIDNIIATGQNDTITGNASANNINGGGGNDIIDGGGGVDVIDGGSGTDTATYVSLSGAVAVNGDTVIDGNGNNETLTNIEIIAGTNLNDTFTSTAGNNQYQGLSGNDTFIASQGTDIFEGGNGTDELRFNTTATNTTLLVNLGLSGFKTATGTGVNTSFNRIETLIGSLQNNDEITYGTTTTDIEVNLKDNVATGIDGDADYDITGFENVTGGSGNDTIHGDAFTNFLDGGAGSDILLSSTNQNGTVNLASSGNQISGFTGGDEEFTGDTAVNFENFIHTGAGNITVTGSTGRNTIVTGSGNDIIAGGAGADSLDGNSVANANLPTDIVFDTFTGQTTATGWELIQGISNTTPTIDNTNTTFTNFLGRVTGGQTLKRDYTVTGTKDHAVLEFDFYRIDSWDTESAYFNINGVNILAPALRGDINYYNRNGSVTIGGMTVHYIFTPHTESSNIGFRADSVAWNDQIYKVKFVIDNPVPNQAITFTASAALEANIADESFGLDNVLFYTTNNLLGTDDGIDTLSYAADSVGVTVDLNDDFTGATSNGQDSFQDALGNEIFGGLVPSPNQTAGGAGSHADGDIIRNFDNVIGGSGNDIITTRNYAINNIDAGGGDDRVVGSVDTGDTLDGGTNGAGGDTLVVRNTRNTITNLATNTVTFADYGDDLFGDTFVNFENYESTAFTHEKIIGSTGINRITTGVRDDYLIGGVGNDILNGGANYDLGGDWVGYENNDAVTADLGAGTASSSSEGSDTLTNIENIRTAGGADTLLGSTANNTIDAGAGVDFISGGAGNDVLAGKAGNDTISGDNNNDKISGGTGTDTLSGGNDNDIILGDNSYLNGLTHFYTLNEGTGSTLTNLGTAGGTLTTGYSHVTLSDQPLSSGDGIEWEYGSPDGNNFAHFSRHDSNPRPKLPTISITREFTVSSWVKFDDYTSHIYDHDFVFRLMTANGQNFIDIYRNNYSGQLRIRFQQNGIETNMYVGEVIDSEWMHFSYSMDDAGFIRTYINGEYRAGQQHTGTINPITYDSNYIGIGQHQGSVEIHQMDGGIANFSVHNRTLSSAEVAGLYVDTKTGIDVTATTASNDTINGDAGNDTLSGGDGSDTINGGSGNDTIEEVGNRATDNNNTLNGGDNDDNIYSNLGNNTINGGTGNDALRYDHFTDYISTPLIIDLSSGGSFDGTVTDGTNTDSFSNIEIIYSGNGADIIIGDAGNNTFFGRGGNDSFYGAAGNDVLNGGDNRDTVDFTLAASAVTANLGTGLAGTDITGVVSIDGNGGSDTLQSIENFTGSNFNDTVTGSTADNTISTGDGNDTINGTSGTDTINGGSGTDTLNYTSFNQTTTITTTSITGSLSGVDTYLGIENFNTGAGSDTFTATASALLANPINYDLNGGSDTVNILSGVLSGAASQFSDNFDDVEILDFRSATGSLSLTGDDIAALTDSNRILRLNISSSFSETITSGANYALTNTTNNGTHTTYDFTFGANTAKLNVYET